MAFSTIHRAKQAHNHTGTPDVVLVALYKSNGPPVRTSLNVRFRSSIMQKLGWKPGDYVTVQEGSGQDAGVLLFSLAENPANAYKLSPPGGHESNKTGNYDACVNIVSTVFRLHEMPQDHGCTVEVAVHQTFNRECRVMLPEWVKPVASA